MSTIIDIGMTAVLAVLIYEAILWFFGLSHFSHRKPKEKVEEEPTHVGWEWVDEPGDSDLIITLVDGRRYRGSGTVWHRMPSGKRAGTFLESYLSEVYQRAEWAAEKGQ